MGLNVQLNLRRLETRFARFSDNVPLENTQSGYDAFYATAFALMIAGQRNPDDLSGENIAQGLGRLVAGPTTQVGPNALRNALVSPELGNGLDLVGSSGELNWQEDRHQPISDVGLWCLTRDEGGTLSVNLNTGPSWSHSTDLIVGEYRCP